MKGNFGRYRTYVLLNIADVFALFQMDLRRFRKSIHTEIRCKFARSETCEKCWKWLSHLTGHPDKLLEYVCQVINLGLREVGVGPELGLGLDSGDGGGGGGRITAQGE